MPRSILKPIELRRNDGAMLATALRREVLAELVARAKAVIPAALDRDDVGTAVRRIGNRRRLASRARGAAVGHVARVGLWHRRRFREVLRYVGRRDAELASVSRLGRRTVRDVGRFAGALVDDFREALARIAEERPGLSATALVDLARARISRRIGIVAPDIMRSHVADMTEARERSAGIHSYVWVTRMDDRVRPTHRRNEGRVFRWTEPPPTGHPGTDYGCRCVARGVFDRRRRAA